MRKSKNVSQKLLRRHLRVPFLAKVVNVDGKNITIKVHLEAPQMGEGPSAPPTAHGEKKTENEAPRRSPRLMEKEVAKKQ
ncbi:hypothetical protein KIN20_014356 [Parelaphostrongylus tenuis]|uniref:Uncharacterized protein n=1 Tax=Parelaphostrongylus tenuis TaxID=148309 RepID=A0AAD5QNA8_PARTN|nr:hypothetical protein KIN20_014356 [Parelaphostrongylus tenuis]